MHNAHVFVFAALLLQTVAPPVKPAATATYRDSALHFSFSYPNGLNAIEGLGAEIVDKTRDQAATDTTKAAANCISMPLMAMDTLGDKGVLMMLQLNFECLGAPASADILPLIAKNSLSQGLAKLGTPTLGTPSTYKLDGHDALFTSGSAATNGAVTKYGGISCVLIEKTAACWVAMASDKTTTNGLLASSITFEGHAPQPLVPADVLAK